MGNRTNYGTGRMTVDNRQKNERSRSGNPYSSHVKAGKHAGTVYNFKRKSRIRKSLTRLPILLEFIHKYIFLNFVSFYNGLNSNVYIIGRYSDRGNQDGKCDSCNRTDHFPVSIRSEIFYQRYYRWSRKRLIDTIIALHGAES